eukprot:PRCOL_00007010-RA
MADGEYGRLADDVNIPKASLEKVLKENLGGGVRVAGDAKDALIAVCGEFVALLTAQANELCEAQKKGKGAGKISPAHVLEALEELGLSSLIEPVKALDAATRESVEDRLATKRKRKQAGAGEMTEEEAMRLQQELFAKARAKMDGGAGGSA